MITVFRKLLPVMCVVASAAATAAPVGYSVNSDAPNGDQLHMIDLATGEASLRGEVLSATGVRKDVEGMAFSPDGLLWGVDESVRRLFPISTETGLVTFSNDVEITGLEVVIGGGHDFGMTFTCSGALYVSSVATQSLYRLDLDGAATRVGEPGSLGVNISALAAWGDPVQLYGLSDGAAGGGGTDSASLFRIDPETGAAELIGPLGPEAGDYTQAGLSFDDDGNLWALTDRSNLGNAEYFPSEVLRIDPATGTASRVSTTTLSGSGAVATGFESLAVAPPSGCLVGQEPEEKLYAVPALDSNGLTMMLLALLGTGLLGLRRRTI